MSLWIMVQCRRTAAGQTFGKLTCAKIQYKFWYPILAILLRDLGNRLPSNKVPVGGGGWGGGGQKEMRFVARRKSQSKRKFGKSTGKFVNCSPLHRHHAFI